MKGQTIKVADSISYIATMPGLVVCAAESGHLNLVKDNKALATSIIVKGIRCIKIVEKWLIVET